MLFSISSDYLLEIIEFVSLHATRNVNTTEMRTRTHVASQQTSSTQLLHQFIRRFAIGLFKFTEVGFQTAHDFTDSSSELEMAFAKEKENKDYHMLVDQAPFQNKKSPHPNTQERERERLKERRGRLT